jgi:hypothetical protein
MACTTIRTRDTLNTIADDPALADAVAQVALDALGRLLGTPQGGLTWRGLTSKPEEKSQGSMHKPDDKTSSAPE